MNRRSFISSAVALSGAALPLVGRSQATSCPPPTVDVVGGSSVQTSCTLPRYMSAMADFEVRDLTGSYAPANGTVSMFSVLPAEWQLTGQPNGANSVFQAWSGGAGDPIGRRLFVHGGGHGDGSNNGLYVFDFDGSDAPKGWSIAPNSLSALSDVTLCTETYKDGKPTSIHTYDQLFYDTNLRRFYRFGGSPHCQNGAGMERSFYYDFELGKWVEWILSSNLRADLGATLMGAPDGSQLFYLSATNIPFFVDVTSGAEKPVGSTPFGTQGAGPCSAYDSRRRQWAVFFSQSSSTPEALVVTIDWKAKNWSYSKTDLTGPDAADLNGEGACVLYDSARDSFWVFANREVGAPISSIYEVDAASFTVTRHALSSPIQAYDAPKGGYNRHVWLEDWRVIGTVHKHDSPVSVIKLPDA
jgi:hypothetical protein